MTPDADPPVPKILERDFKYYIFDWDNNILHMPTQIHLERRRADGTWEPISVSTSAFAVLRSDRENIRPPKGDWELSFADFRDLENRPESAFLADTRRALDAVLAGADETGPSFRQFQKALVEGRLFAIVTARGHKSSTLRKGVEMFIERMLSPADRATMIANLRGYMEAFGEAHDLLSDAEVVARYLDLNHYHAVTSPEFRSRMGQKAPVGEQTEEAKQFAIRDFVGHVIRIIRKAGMDRPVSVGFSDDDSANTRAVERYIHQELAREFPGVKFVVYDTSDPEVEQGRKIIVTGQLELPLD